VRLRARRPARAAARSAARAAAFALGASLALAACEGGAIGQSTAASNGQSFVSGSAGTTVYGATSGPAAPRVTGTLLSGSKFALTQYRGHVVVVNFWGSWCTPCRAEAPSLSQLARHFTPRSVRFLGVGISYPSLNDPGDEIALAFRDTVPPAGIPTTLVIGRNGRIVARVIGEVSYPGLHGLISQALAQPA